MDDDSLRKIIAEIDELPHDGEPRSHLSIGKPPCYVFLTANKEGLVSLARALLKAAISPKTDVETFEVTRIEEPNFFVIPAQAGIQRLFLGLDSRLRGNDEHCRLRGNDRSEAKPSIESSGHTG